MAAFLSLLFSGRLGRRTILPIRHDDGALINPLMLNSKPFGDLTKGDRFYFIRDLNSDNKDNLCVKVGTYAGLDSRGMPVFVPPHLIVYGPIK
jgi:hypothetical protein